MSRKRAHDSRFVVESRIVCSSKDNPWTPEWFATSKAEARESWFYRRKTQGREYRIRELSDETKGLNQWA
jgi:hypothetical protein